MLCWYCLFGINLESFVYSFLLALFIEQLRRKLETKQKQQKEKEGSEKVKGLGKKER